jgi:Helix-turn-helix domain
MQRLHAFKYELIPNGDQQRQLRRIAGACRYVFDRALALQKKQCEQGEKRFGYVGLCKQLTDWRNGEETHCRDVLGEVRNAPVSQSCGKWCRDYLHKATTTIRSMSRSAAGTVEQPRKFSRQLEYKLAWADVTTPTMLMWLVRSMCRRSPRITTLPNQ